MSLDKNTVSYLSSLDNKEILVYYTGGDVDTYEYDEFATFGFTKVNVLERTEHLDLSELNFLLEKLGFDPEKSLV